MLKRIILIWLYVYYLKTIIYASGKNPKDFFYLGIKVRFRLFFSICLIEKDTFKIAPFLQILFSIYCAQTNFKVLFHLQTVTSTIGLIFNMPPILYYWFLNLLIIQNFTLNNTIQHIVHS